MSLHPHMQNFHDRVNTRHRAGVLAGLHDEQCEWRAAGHFLCNCSKRKREAEGYTTPPGELEWKHPDCPRCDNEVEHDGDSWRCDPCKVYWNDSGTEAQFFDDHGELDTTHWDAREAAK